VGYPGLAEFVIEHDEFPVLEASGPNIDWTREATFPAHSRTLYNPLTLTEGAALPGRPGNYTLIVFLIEPSYNASGSCTVEVRPNPAGFNGTESLMLGDWVKYDVAASWIGSGTQPSSVTEFKQILWEMDRVEFAGSSPGDFLFNTTTHFKNGTDQYLMWSDGVYWLIFPSALKKGDTLQFGA
jgi:hypothetical protein